MMPAVQPPRADQAMSAEGKEPEPFPGNPAPGTCVQRLRQPTRRPDPPRGPARVSFGGEPGARATAR